MNNYEYIIASLPVLSPDWKYPEGEGFDYILEEIRNQLSASDASTVDLLLKGLDPENLNQEFYRTALSHGNRFIREFFRFDLEVRNMKVDFLNRRLGRPEGTDIISGMDQEGRTLFATGEMEEADRVVEILHGQDLLSREKALDGLYNDKVSQITTFNYFDLDAVLGFITKLRIIHRWLALDPVTGKEMFSHLLAEVRGSYNDLEYKQ